MAIKGACYPVHKHLNLLWPQWQAGPDRQVYHGAMQLCEEVSKQMELRAIPVDLAEEPTIINNIRGYQSITSQLAAAVKTITDYSPSSIFTIGGNCSSSIASIAYLNHRLKGDLAVVWLDSHGDLNTPESSLSKLFTGMPIRHLLGEGAPEIGGKLVSYLKPEQIILAGTSDLDPAESKYIKMTELTVLPPQVLKDSPETISSFVSSKGYAHVYVHNDTDVLQANDFPFSAWPNEAGITMETLENILDDISNKFPMVGASLVEFVPSDTNGIAQLLRMVKKILVAITKVA